MGAGRKIGPIVGFVIGGLVLFVVTTAWMYARGVPWWLCAPAGALIFPLLPVGWHILAERARKRRLAAAKAPPKSSLTGGDRFMLRLGLVAVVSLGPLLVFRPGQTWRAVRDHGAWFIPTPPPPPRVLTGDARVVGQVPPDAEYVIWLRAVDALSDKSDKPAPDQPEEMLVALRAGELMVVVRGPDKALKDLELDKANEQLRKQTWFPLSGSLTAKRRASDLVVLVTPGWATASDEQHAGKTAGPTAILARLAAAPTDAVIIAAAAPPRPVAGLALQGAQAWLRISKETIGLDAEATTADALAAAAVITRARAELAALTASAPADCKAQVQGLLGKVQLDSTDGTVRLSARWAPKQVGEAMMCGFAVAMQHADWK